MRKILLVVAICVLIVILPVYAGSKDSDNPFLKAFNKYKPKINKDIEQVFTEDVVKKEPDTKKLIRKNLKKILKNKKFDKVKVKKIFIEPEVPLPEEVDYYLHTNIMATMFWAGEGATSDNGYISNVPSAWYDNWVAHFGGVDNPYSRNGYWPEGFIPHENPFYCALPYTDFTYYGPKENRFDVIPWVKEVSDQDSLVKDRWIKVIYNGTKNSNTQKNICYCQWADAGPYESDDVEYVFGTAQPAITIGLKSGIDLSPAMQNCLNMGDHNDYVSWQFVDEPIEGPWTNIVTNSPPDWN